MGSNADILTTSDDISLRFHATRSRRAKGVVVIVHGLGEHKNRYTELENWLKENEYTCYAYDQRGHGQSTGVRTHVDSFWQYVDDLDLMHDMVHRCEPNLPLYVFGHSMGAIVATLNAIQNQGNWCGLIVSGCPVTPGQPLPVWRVFAGRALAVLFPQFRVNNGLETAQLSRDDRVAAAYVRDSRVEQSITVGWATRFLDAKRYVLENAYKITLPVLVLHGGSDAIADVEGSRRLFEHLGSRDKTFNEYPGLLHELHHELRSDRTKVFDDIAQWLSVH